MMYLSSLLIDVGDNPDRPRPGRAWLRNVYRVHQRLCMAFPSDGQRREDPDFLKPFRPDGFRDVHTPRTEQSAFLYRIDVLPGGRAMILVQSAGQRPPDWEYAFHNARYLLAAPSECRPFRPAFQAGRVLRFRLKVNPTRRLREASVGPDGRRVSKSLVGHRVPVKTGELESWLARRAERCGFRFDPAKLTRLEPGYVYWSRGGARNQTHRLRSVLYEGLIEVIDAEALRAAVISGIGPAKAFGFGLLSLAPAE